MTEPANLQPEFGPPAKEVDCMQYIPVPSAEADKLHGQVLAQIDRLPAELLAQIFQLCIRASVIAFPSCDVHRHLKKQLASVSRRWRDIILNAANFWTTIRLTPTWSKSFVKVHLARSSTSSLDIEMCGRWPRSSCAGITVHELLHLLIACSHRWRSVIVRRSAPDAQLIQLLSIMKDKTFPSLTRFSVEYMDGWLCDGWVASQLCTGHFPRLQHLGLGGPIDPSSVEGAPSNLASLALRLDDWGPTCIIQHLSLQKLTSLTLSGRVEALRLDPSSIQLPRLEKFVCKARDGYVLIHAIAAPNLLHLEYSSCDWIGLADDQWNLHIPRYPNVTDLVLPHCGIDCSNEIASFQFPAVRHVTLHKHGIQSLFGSRDDTTAVMYWLDLETLTVEDLNINDDDENQDDDLIAWLQRRQQMGRPNLLVNLTFSRYWDGDVPGLCLALHRYCTLEVAGIHFDPAVDLIAGDELSVCTFLSLPLHVKVYSEQISGAFLKGVKRKTQSSCDCEGCISDHQALKSRTGSFISKTRTYAY